MLIHRFIAACALLFFGVPGHAGPIEDFTPQPPSEWRYFSDQVMGGVSEGQARLQTVNGEEFIRLTGTVSTENRGGFIQARADLERGFPADAKGVVLKVRGNGQRYFVHLRTQGMLFPWQYYQAPFDTTAEWQTIRLPFSAFQPSGRFLRRTPRPETVTSLGLVAYGRDHQADVTARWIGLY